jgi:hypothetical protein
MLLAANLSTSATEMAFNGNDAVVCSKRNLIDIIGTFNGGTPISQLMKPCRKATVMVQLLLTKLLNGMSLH